MQWAGTKLINLRILVAPDQWDKPQEQLKTIILPPDPVSILNARPEPYGTDEQTYRLTMSGQVRYQQGGTQARLESNLQGAQNAGTYPD
jgi:hypothetical protein